MATHDHSETERKYQVDTTATVPFHSKVADERVDEIREAQLDAVYFDTAKLDLLRRGTTLRRRTGGDDEGWHLKISLGPDRKAEIQHPLGRAVRSVPRKVVDPVRAIVRDHPLVPVATISTHRTMYSLLQHGEPVATLCDDQVVARALLDDQDDQDDHAWREWELEVAEGHDASSAFALFEPALLEAGARRADHPSKLGHVLAHLPQARTPGGSRPGRHQDMRDLLGSRLEQQISALHTSDAAVRGGSADGIHRMRIAARRLRSALSTTGPLFEQPPDDVRAELRWLGQVLGPARDALVIRERLEAALEAEPGDLVLGPVHSRLRAELVREQRLGMAHATEALHSERYYRLLDALDSLSADLQLTPAAKASPRRLMGDLVRRDATRLHRAMQAVAGSEPDERDQALHEARKKAKRLRYAAELAAPAGGRRAKKLARRAAGVQKALGRHQDSVVARQHLRELGAQAFLHGENGFTFGLLHAAERLRAEQAEQDFRTASDRVPRPRAAAAWVSSR
jgi:CHAD domain-containing protein